MNRPYCFISISIEGVDLFKFAVINNRNFWLNKADEALRCVMYSICIKGFLVIGRLVGNMGGYIDNLVAGYIVRGINY